MNPRTRNILIGIDQFFYVVITLGQGMPDETMSSAAWRTEQKGRLLGRISRPVIDWIFSRFGDDDHCFKSYISEKYHTQLPDEFK